MSAADAAASPCAHHHATHPHTTATDHLWFYPNWAPSDANSISLTALFLPANKVASAFFALGPSWSNSIGEQHHTTFL
ncbi:hypothetical protein U9M48_018571 [Paspalum notatum var. saurae]|uniref:Uncharacterized protein n=1 Tax=Paspalum notatum var. saurae TaxID=547442 RepID=A0AAQ3TD65_PASNO